jgi:DNA-binding transcriptional LysR family regulator
MAVAEELHFARAAERLHIEQSPLSRTIKELESDIGAQLFDRNSRGTRLTKPGEALAEAAKRIFQAVEQARCNVQAAAAGYCGSLRIALSDGVLPQQLAAVLARCREEEPEVEIRLFEVKLSQQLKGLRDDLFDVGFARSKVVGEGLTAQPVWQTPLTIVVPARHPLLSLKQIPLAEALNYPLVLFHPRTHSGLHQQIDCLLRQVPSPVTIAEHVSSHEVMFTLVAAGYGLGLTCEALMALRQNAEIVARPLAGDPPLLNSYLLRPSNEPNESLKRFIARVTQIDQSV